MKKISIPIIALCLSFVGCQNATIAEREVTMKTYPFSDPNPVANPDNLFYPYHTFDGYSHTGEPKEWQAVELENQYIKVTILPEIGGKIWGAVEKSTGNEFIYFNNVVKFRNIAMRGPWTSGGIEANFGIIGHAPTCSTPIDYTTRENKDGSVSCFIGSLDMLTSTWWSIEVRLDKDKSYFTTHTKWNNTSPLAQPYYHWMNAGYKATDDMTFCFPGNGSIGHAGEANPWPMDAKGRNLNRYAENNFGSDKSNHVIGEISDFFGAYWDDTNFGTVHHSDFDEKLGMKVFLWGLSRQGMIWEDLLTDDDGQYLELQSGRMFNQAVDQSNRTPYKHISFEPYTMDNWTEYWYPIKDTKRFVKANRYGAFNIIRNENEIELLFSPTSNFNEKMTLYDGKNKIYEGIIKATPSESWKEKFSQKNTSPLKVVIGDNLLVYEENASKRATSRPRELKQQFDENSLYGLYLNAKLLSDQKKYTPAMAQVDKALALDSNFSPAINLKATLLYRMGEYERALEYALLSISINSYDADANFIYGLTGTRLGRSTDAKDGFSLAAYSPSHRQAANIELARQWIREENYGEALRYAKKAISISPGNENSIVMLALATRKSGIVDEAEETISNLEQASPLNHFARTEKYFQGKGSKKELSSAIRNEMPWQTYLELAGWYETMNCNEEAIELLEMAEKNAIIYYRLAYLYNKSGNERLSATALKSAIEASPEFMFPYRPETLEALLWAKQRDASWKTTYYLALNLWAMGNREQSAVLLQSCGSEPDYAPFYLTRANACNTTDALTDLLAAEKTGNSWRVGYEIINYYISRSNFSKALEYGEKYNKLFPENYIISLKYALAMCRTAKYEECVAFLKNIRVLPNEGASEGRIIYRDANLLTAIEYISKGEYEKALSSIEGSKEYIENLGVGKPYDELIDMRSTDFITAMCYESKGDKTTADEYYKKVVNGMQSLNSNTLLIALVQKEQGNEGGFEFSKKQLSGNETLATLSKYLSKNEVAKIVTYINSLNEKRDGAAWEQPTGDKDLRLVGNIIESFFRIIN